MSESPATKLVMLAELKKKVAELEKEVRTELVAEMLPGERRTAAVKVGGKPVILGSATLAKDTEAYRVTDLSAFMEWMRQTHPDVIQTVETVPEWFAKAVQSTGHAPDTGEEVPGVELKTVPGSLRVLPAKDAAATLTELMADGFLDWSEVLPIEGRSMSASYIVVLEDPRTGTRESWAGEAENGHHAKDLARYELDPDDSKVVIAIELAL